MALTFPLDILANFYGWTPVFDTLFRQEQSRQANGVTRVKDFDDPLWKLQAVSFDVGRRQLDVLRATVRPLDNGINTFLGYPMSRRYPLAYPRGSWPTGLSFNGHTAHVFAIGGDNTSLRVSDLPAGYVVSLGDFVQAGNDLYQAMESVTASGAGTTPAFEVRPQIWPTTLEGALVSVKQPHCIMTITPGSISSPSGTNGRGTLTFEGIEYRP